MSNVISFGPKNEEAIRLLSGIVEGLKSGEVTSVAIAYTGQYPGIMQSLGEGDCPFKLIGLVNFLTEELMQDKMEYTL